MSKVSSGQMLLAILVSSTISVGSTVAIMNYAPSLVPMPVPMPDIQLASVSLGSSFQCEAHADWSTIDELTKTFSVRQDSVLIIIFSSKFSTLYTQNNYVDEAILEMNVYVDGTRSNPSDVVISIYDQDAKKGTVAVFHYPMVSAGTHTVTLSWRNRGFNAGEIKEPVVEILAIPVVNAK